MVSSHAYKLELPELMRIHPIFHINLLRLVEPDNAYLPGQQVEPPELVIVDVELEYYVKRIVDLRFN